MKKIVSVLVTAISVVAIIFVAIFGTKPQGIVPKVYIDSVTILPSDDSQYAEQTDTDYAKMVLVYDESQEVIYNDVHYMPYIFKTQILPENATDRSFYYYVDETSKTYIDFPPDTENASSRGAFLIAKMNDIDFATVYVHCKTLDGGKAPISTLMIIIDYR